MQLKKLLLFAYKPISYAYCICRFKINNSKISFQVNHQSVNQFWSRWGLKFSQEMNGVQTVCKGYKQTTNSTDPYQTASEETVWSGSASEETVWSGSVLFAIQTGILWLPALITNILFANWTWKSVWNFRTFTLLELWTLVAYTKGIDKQCMFSLLFTQAFCDFQPW